MSDTFYDVEQANDRIQELLAEIATLRQERDELAEAILPSAERKEQWAVPMLASLAIAIDASREAANAENARLRAGIEAKVQEWRRSAEQRIGGKDAAVIRSIDADELDALLAPPVETT